MVAQRSFSRLAIIKLEPTIGNISSEHDDNVEALTDNADSNDVGIE